MFAAAAGPRRGLATLSALVLLAGCGDGGTRPPDLNRKPTATIRVPALNSTFAAGDVVSFAGSGSDPEDGALPHAALTWWADLHHDDHAHPFMSVLTGVDSGTVTIPVRGETSDNIWYRFYLVARDSDGSADTIFRDIQPRKTTVQFTSVPAGAQLTIDGQPRTTPFQVVGVVGMERDVAAPTPQVIGGQGYTFTSWSQGGTREQMVLWPAAAATYTATFTATQDPNQPPTVTVTAPAAGAQVVVQSAVTVSAAAADPDGTVAQVQFFANQQEIGTDNSAPYSVQWTPAATGAVSLTARATDNQGAQTTSAAIAVTVNPASSGDVTPPTAQLTAPSDQATNLTGTLTLTATASDNVGVAGVQFQVDGQNVGAEDTAAPYQASVNTASYARGVHVVRARSRDTAGNVSPWATATVSFGGAQNLNAGFASTQFAGSLPDLPTSLAFTPDGRMLVTLKQGAVRVISNGSLLAQPFATFTVDDGGERGLLGIAVHPQFAANGYVYVHYTTTTSGIARISRLTANGNVMQAGSEVVLVNLPPSGSPFHNGGAIHFGPDGRLYVAIGDDGTPANAQNLTTPYGKILRFNDDGTIPTDNPFYATTTGINRAIWARGLRNPFTFAFQPGTGRMFINDVGQDTWEEVNEGGSGRNFGWPGTEGPTTNPSFTSPVYAYRHFGGLVTGFSIVGASFYNPPVQLFPAAYNNSYFFADYVNNWVHRLDYANDNAVYAFAWMPNNITDLRVGPDGALYVLLATSFSSGQIRRITFSP